MRAVEIPLGWADRSLLSGAEILLLTLSVVVAVVAYYFYHPPLRPLVSYQTSFIETDSDIQKLMGGTHIHDSMVIT
jgi:hypothetical protein